MSENTSDQPKPQQGIDRRQILRLGLKVAKAAPVVVGLGVAAALTTNEVKAGKEGFSTHNATFFPLYEDHLIGIPVEKVPDNLDIYYREFASDDSLKTPPGYLFLTKIDTHSDSGPDRFLMNPEIAAKLAKSETEIMFGDISIPDEDKHQSFKDYLVENGVSLSAMIAALGGAYALRRDKNIPRRAVLRAGAVGAAVIASKPFLEVGLVNLAERHQSAFERVLTRLEGFVSNFRPDDAIVFLRNALMADKMLEAANDFQEKNKRKPRIAYQIGGAHSGIEDLLELGQGFCRWLVTNVYSDAFLRRCIERNGGVDNFSSARLIRQPKDLVYNPNSMNDMDRLPDMKMEDRRITDKKLVDTLQQRFPPKM